MIGRYLNLAVFVLLLSFSSVGQQVSSQPTPLPCTKDGRDPSQPWSHNAKVLESFPRDNPLPRYVGAFRDKNWKYQVILYQDAKGIFGKLLTPVLDADSPTSALYDATFDSRSGALRFSAKVGNGQLLLNGVLRGRISQGTVTQHDLNERVTLKRIKWHDDDGDLAYTSRAQFDCAMILYRRY